MALILTNSDQRGYLKFLYEKYGTNPFQYNDVRDQIPKKDFTKFCNDKFFVKDGNTILIKPRKTPHDYNRVKVINWKLNMYIVRKYVDNNYCCVR